MRRSVSWRPQLRLLGVLLGLVLSVWGVGALFSGKQTKFDEFALGEGVVEKFGQFRGQKIHCSDLLDLPQCIRTQRISGISDIVLWLGNSQLHAITKYQEGDRVAPEIVHEMLRERNRFLFAVSQPKGNLQEHLLLLAYLLPIVRPTALVLPVVFDNFRDVGIRDTLLNALNDPEVMTLLRRSAAGAKIVEANREAANKDAGRGDLAGLHDTAQERVEAALTLWLERHWQLWASRPEARGKLMTSLYNIRNWVFGIKSTTIRRVIPGRFEENWAVLEALVQLARAHDVAVYLYIPPLRGDVARPYPEAEYAAFRKKIFDEFDRGAGISVSDLEGAVPDHDWSARGRDSMGEEILDFMHLTGTGHRYLAHAIYEWLEGARKQ